MKNNLLTIVTGASGVGAIEAVDAVTSIDPSAINDTVGLIGQLVIILATIWGLFKKKKTDSQP